MHILAIHILSGTPPITRINRTMQDQQSVAAIAAAVVNSDEGRRLLRALPTRWCESMDVRSRGLAQTEVLCLRHA